MSGQDANGRAGAGWDSGYEWKAVLLLALAFGLVGLDRWILAPLFPAMMADLHLSYADLGLLVGALALSWGLFAILMGSLSDRFGRRKILIPSLIIFSLLSAFSGMAGGFAMLIIVRVVMGAAEGAFCPASVAATAEASHPRRRGLNQGLQLSGFSLFGFGLAPIIATQLLAVVPSWREVFMIVAIPGLILAAFLYRILRDPPRQHAAQGQGAAPGAPAESIRWSTLLRNRNVMLATAALFCAMSCIFVMGAMVPSYLIDSLHLDPMTMGIVMSSMGWGGFLGQFGLPALSDFIGRRWTTVITFIGALVSLQIFAAAPADATALFLRLGACAFFGIGLLALLTGPIATEAVPPALASSAVGLVSGAGEIFGGGIAPVLSGMIAQHYGIAQIFWLPTIGLALGIVVALFLRETAPRKTGA